MQCALEYWSPHLAEISLTGDQMLTVLETVAKKGPVGAADVARTCDINRTVAYRLLVTLEQRAYVRRGHDGYTLGSAINDLVRHLDRDISSIARPLMATLANAVGETVVLHCLNKDEAVVTEQALGNNILFACSTFRAHAIHSTLVPAAGRCLLSRTRKQSRAS
jgi:IclR family KDG regulon transcriptional repressor